MPQNPPDRDRGIVPNSGSDPQRPGGPARPRGGDPYPPGTSARETSVPTDPAAATHEPGPPRPPEDRSGDDTGTGRSGIE
ncbi:MAG TPA: hypothetical protein VFM29_00270 [Vicinamibacteria bacterium]|nr:hypothetical protein [Vicinamibacteria bacterium]